MSNDDAAWFPLEEVAQVFVEKAEASFADDHDMSDKRPTWQALLDGLPDHNQTMIDAIEDTSPTLDSIVSELMGRGSDAAATAWTGLINFIFERAQKIWEET